MKPITREWIDKAEGDFAVATTIMSSRKSRIHDAVCFHCQQCVEKMMKARLCEDSVSFPKTHDIEVLLNLLMPAYPLWAALLPLAKTSALMPLISATLEMPLPQSRPSRR